MKNRLNSFINLFGLAIAKGICMSVYGFALMKQLFDMIFTDHMPINLSGIAIAVGILMPVVLMTVSTQIRKVSKSNPVNGLNTE